MREIDNVTQTSAVFNQKKNNGLKLANEISYNLSQLNVQNTKSLLELDALRTKISETSKKTSVLGEEISSFNGIYLQSLAKIDDLNATINHRIDQAFSFNIQDGNEAISTKNIARSSNLLKKFIQSIRSKPKPKVERMVGTTYHFNTTTYPSFFIKNIELNDINSPDYLKGKSVAINSNFFNQTKIYLKQTDKKNYKKMILKVYGQPDNSHFVELKLEKLQLPSKTVFDTKELQVNFITNTSELYVTEIFLKILI